MWHINSFVISPFLCCSKRNWCLSALRKRKLIFADSDHRSTRLPGTKEWWGGRGRRSLQRRELKENGMIHWCDISWRSSGECGDFPPNWKGREREYCQLFLNQMSSACYFPALLPGEWRSGGRICTVGTTACLTKAPWARSMAWDQQKTTKKGIFGGVGVILHKLKGRS